jgi:hypothetical protein
MKRIIRDNMKYLEFFLVITLFIFLAGCGGVTPTSPIIISFSGNPLIVTEGESATLSWTVTDATTITIDQGIGSVALSGSTSVSPASTTTYTLTAINSAGSSSATVIITVSPAIIIEQTMTLQPVPGNGKDAYVFDNQPTWNYNLEYLVLGVSSIGTTWRSYLQFDLSSLPPAAVILHASLGLYYFSSYSVVLSSLPMGLYEVTGSWGEDTVTWNNQPASSSDAIDIQNIPASPTNDFVYWQIDDLVRGWHDGSIDNYGILLRRTYENSNSGYVEFWSSDYGTGNQRPKLVIDYYIP